MPRTIIVSNRLPVKVKKQKKKLSYQVSEGGLATGLGSIYKKGDNLWIGWPGIAGLPRDMEKDVTRDLAKDNMAPVFLTKKEVEEYYEGFSNETLWPNFHYFNQYIIFEDEYWAAYKAVNKKFAREILKYAEPGDRIWIHDYQLLLLPEMIRKELPKAAIGFFLHIPFPSYESFRLLPWRKEILMGMLGADFLAFHTYDDMRHFLSSVNRLAGIGNDHGKISHGNRIIAVDALPMGIDYNKYAMAATSPATLDKEVRYRTSIGDSRLILSIDRLDYSKGIPQRLKAFNLFLERYPEYLNKVSLLMVVVPSRDTVPKYMAIREEIELLVGRINGKYGRLNWLPIHYFYRSFALESLSALYRMASVGLVTPMRDGMNLVAKEFIASKLDKKGVLILSEMAGASKELSDAILINPNDVNQMVEALKQALEMPEEEQEQHMETMQETIQKYSIHQWVKIFMERLDLIKEEQQSLETKLLDEPVVKKIKSSYKKAKNRLLFLDYDGTLVGFKGNPRDSKPDKKLISILKSLTDDPKNNVVVISGRSGEMLDEWLGSLHLTIVAEHGAYIKNISTENPEFKLISDMDNGWKDKIRGVMEGYVARTPGSFIEEKDYSLVWHYRKVETGLGEIRTRELMSHLKFATAHMHLMVLEGNMVVEVKNNMVNKGVAVEKLINEIKPDFITCLGDDWTDEDMFNAIPDSGFTVKVGSSHSAAKFYVDNYEDVRKFLSELAS